MEIPDLNVVQTISYLLPGFVAAWVFYGLTAHPKKTPFERAVQALIFTALIQTITLGVRELLLLIGRQGFSLGTWTHESTLAAPTIVAVIFGLVVSCMANCGLPHRWLPDWVTKRTTAPSEWFSTFNADKRYVYLHLKGGRRLYGWPFEWPDHPDTGHFVIAQPQWVLDEDNRKVPLYMAHRLLIRADEVEMVEFEKRWPDEVTAPVEQIREAERALLNLQKKANDGDSTDGSKSALERRSDAPVVDDREPAASNRSGCFTPVEADLSSSATAERQEVSGNGQRNPRRRRKR